MLRASATLVTALCLMSCAETSPIQPAALSKSHFADAAYKGEFVTTGSGTPGAEAYRVFVQGATGFVPIQSVRDDAEQRAKEFCGREHQTMESLAETTAKPPYIFGNFPRVEIVFDCVAVPDAQPAYAGDDSRYIRLTNLKNCWTVELLRKTNSTKKSKDSRPTFVTCPSSPAVRNYTVTPQLTPRSDIHFHGTPAETVVQIMKSRVLRPNRDGEIFCSRFEWTSCLSHGAARRPHSAKLSCVIKVQLGSGDIKKVFRETPGARDTVILRTFTPIPALVLELHVRNMSPRGSEEPTQLEHYLGEEVKRSSVVNVTRSRIAFSQCQP
jgi:hypothetical protein